MDAVRFKQVYNNISIGLFDIVKSEFKKSRPSNS